MAKDYDVVVLGAGPGGYVAAIRAAQLGQKVAIVEKQYWGGICLNVGCIPSKALINAAKLHDKMKHGADIGLLADNVRVDMKKMQQWKGEVVHKLTSGVKQLLKSNGCDYRTGTARQELFFCNDKGFVDRFTEGLRVAGIAGG